MDFSQKAIRYRVPGRINLIGEHTDYNDGFVFPGAINLGLNFIIETNQEEYHTFYSGRFNEYDRIDRSGTTSDRAWSRYFKQVIALFYKRNSLPSSIKCSFEGNLPIGAGVSSSSALACGLIFGLNELFSLHLSKMEMVRLASIAENGTGLQGGLMDQFSIVHGVQNSLLLLDCKDMSFEVIPVQLGDYEIVLFDTRVEHHLVNTGYNDRRKDCEEGLLSLQKHESNIMSVRDITKDQLDRNLQNLSNHQYRRLRHVIQENQRVQQSKAALTNNQLEVLGDLLYASHESLRQDYEVSCEELDFIVNWTKSQSAILGSRMMGGGFGGCTIQLVKTSDVEELFISLAQLYRNKFNLDLHYHRVDLSQGIHLH